MDKEVEAQTAVFQVIRLAKLWVKHIRGKLHTAVQKHSYSAV